MDSAKLDAPAERQGPNIRDEIDGVKFRKLAPGITTHPLVRSGRPCLEGTGLKVTDIVVMKNYHQMNVAEIAEHFSIERFMVDNALNYYATYTDYINTDIEIDSLNDEQLAQEHNMEPDPIRFYLDENLSPEIAKQLARHGIDVIRGQLGADDFSHLEHAFASGRVLCTRDRDFVRLHVTGKDHAGIIKGMKHHTVGDWVNYLLFVHSICAPEDLRNNIEHLFRVE